MPSASKRGPWIVSFAKFSFGKIHRGRKSAAPRPNGFIANPNDPASTFLKVRVNSAQGFDLESVEVFVDNQTFGGLVRSFSFGGFTAGHDPLHTDIENNGAADLDGPVFSDGVQNGVRPGGEGLEDFVYTDWQAAQSAVSPGNLSDGEHRLIVCVTNIRNVTNCDTRVSFTIDRTSPTALAQTASGSAIVIGSHPFSFARRSASTIVREAFLG